MLFQDVHEPYSQDLAQAFEEQYPTAGYEGRLVIQPFKTGAKDTKDLSRSVQEVLKKNNPDVLMFTSDNVKDMITVLKTVDADASSSRVKVVMGTAAYAVIEAYAEIEPNKPFVGYNRLLFSTGAYPDEWNFFHAVQSPFFQDYASMFDPHHKHPGTYSYSRPNALVMLGYDAMQTLFYASKPAFEAGKNHPFSPDQLQMALTQIQGAQALQGITGQISFGPDRDPTNKLNFVLYADNQQHLKIACWQGSFFINSPPVKWRCA